MHQLHRLRALRAAPEHIIDYCVYDDNARVRAHGCVAPITSVAAAAAAAAKIALAGFVHLYSMIRSEPPAATVACKEGTGGTSEDRWVGGGDLCRRNSQRESFYVRYNIMTRRGGVTFIILRRRRRPFRIRR